MAKKITQLTELAVAPATGDLFALVDVSAGSTKKIQASNIIPAGSVTPEKLVAGAGTTWAWQSWTPGYTGFSVNPTVNEAKYIQVGKTVLAVYNQLALGTSNATTFTITGLPVAVKVAQQAGHYLVAGADNSANLNSPVWMFFNAIGTVLTLKTAGNNTWTASGTKGVYGWVIAYEVA